MNDRKKIKLLFRHRSMEMGGVEKVMLSLLNNLDRDKFDITVLLSLNQGELRNEIPSHVRKVYLVDGKEDFSKNPFVQKLQLLKRKNKLNKLLKNPAKIDNEILKDSYDIEIGMSYNDFAPVLNSTNINSKKIGWFHSEINTKGFEPLVPGILDAFPKFDEMVYCSNKIKDLMHEHHPNLKYPSENVIKNAIPVEEIKKKSLEKIDWNFKAPVFISVGRLHFRKGYHKLIEAHKMLLNDGFNHTIVIVGDGEDRKKLEDLIKSNAVEESFILLGNKMNPYPYIRHADYFILPSQSEAWPLVLAEALLLQKPTIATDTGDVSQMLEHGKTGLLINYEVQEMYEAMKKFLDNPEMVKEMKQNLTHSEEKFDGKKIFRQVETLFTYLIESKNEEQID